MSLREVDVVGFLLCVFLRQKVKELPTLLYYLQFSYIHSPQPSSSRPPLHCFKPQRCLFLWHPLPKWVDLSVSSLPIWHFAHWLSFISSAADADLLAQSRLQGSTTSLKAGVRRLVQHHCVYESDTCWSEQGTATLYCCFTVGSREVFPLGAEWRDSVFTWHRHAWNLGLIP